MKPKRGKKAQPKKDWFIVVNGRKVIISDPPVIEFVEPGSIPSGLAFAFEYGPPSKAASRPRR